MNQTTEQPSMPALIQPSSPIRAWLYLVGLTFRRQWRGRQLVMISLGLLGTCLVLILTFGLMSGWDRYDSRIKRIKPYTVEHVAGAMAHTAIDQSEWMDRLRTETRPLTTFSRGVVFALYLNFLLPMFSLSFATGAMGYERESRSLVWLMTRPLPRSSVYLAKFLGMLPWCVGMTLGGFTLLCLAGGEIGRQAFTMYAPSIAIGGIAFAAIFHFFGSLLPRPAVVGLLYAFFFETLLSELPIPGTLKRLSVNYYTRCLLYASAEQEQVPTETSSLFVPVEPVTAWCVLIGATIAITALGMYFFGRNDYRDDV